MMTKMSTKNTMHCPASLFIALSFPTKSINIYFHLMYSLISFPSTQFLFMHSYLRHRKLRKGNRVVPHRVRKEGMAHKGAPAA
jgi:hypothetical protein